VRKAAFVLFMGVLALPVSLLASASFQADQTKAQKKVAKGGDDKGGKVDAKSAIAKGKGKDKDKEHTKGTVRSTEKK
jgi:hypothetical protein